MMTKIEWTNKTWSPITGCTPVSTGCKNCYARQMAKRLAGRFGYPKDNPFKVTLRPDRLNQPMGWKNPTMIFTPSMSDLFHEEVPDYFIKAVLYVVRTCQRHIFQVLTKRQERMREFFTEYYQKANHDPFKNLWLGVSVENQEKAEERIPPLARTPAAIRFLSCEPLLEKINLNYLPVNWIIVGSESGPNARPMDEDWVRSLRDQCLESNIPFFYKQKMEGRKKISMPKLDGKIHNEYPEIKNG